MLQFLKSCFHFKVPLILVPKISYRTPPLITPYPSLFYLFSLIYLHMNSKRLELILSWCKHDTLPTKLKIPTKHLTSLMTYLYITRLEPAINDWKSLILPDKLHVLSPKDIFQHPHSVTTFSTLYVFYHITHKINPCLPPSLLFPFYSYSKPLHFKNLYLVKVTGDLYEHPSNIHQSPLFSDYY